MCLALDYANELNQKIEEIKTKYKELEDKEKLYTARQQDLLHEIEHLEKFDLYSGWKLTKSLNELRNERRKVKNEKKVMKMLIGQVSEIHIETGKIENENNILHYVDENKIYKSRENRLINKIKPNHLRECYANQKIPKTKGSSIRVKYATDGEKNHIMNILSRNYIEARLNAEGKYVDLIERK